MTIKRMLSTGLLSCAAALSLTASASAQSADAPPVNISIHYTAAARHLELGGIFYGFMDVDGDLARLTRVGDKLIDLVRKRNDGEDIFRNLTASKVIEALGLTTVKAVGASSRTMEDGLYHNRAIIYTPGGQTGLFKLMGGGAAPFASPAIVPAESDFVEETDLTLGALLEITGNLVRSTDDKRLVRQFEGMLGLPVPVVNLTVRDLISRLDTKVILFGRVVESESIPVPGGKMRIPAFKAVLSFDHLDFLFPVILGLSAQGGPRLKIEKGDGFELIRLSEPPLPEIPFLKPAVYHDLKSKRILITSDLDYLRASLTSSKTLTGDPAFIKAMANLPKEGNSLSYVTPKVADTLLALITTAMDEAAASSASAPSSGEVKAVWDLLTDLSPTRPTVPVAAVRANLPDGILFASNSPGNIKNTIVATAVMAPPALMGAMAAGGFAAYNRIMPGIRARQAARDIGTLKKAEPNPSPFPDAEEPSNSAIRLNLRRIAECARIWFVNNPKANEVTFEKLISAGLLTKPDPVSGESYKGLIIKRTGGSVSVKTKAGDPISLSYQPVTD